MTVSSKAGRYELQQELGRGSMGVVYRAHDPVIGRMVAVKTVELTAEVAGMSHDEMLTRFQTEARAAGLLAHPNIVVVYDAGEDDGLFYITMELVEGRSLQEQMNLRQSFPLPRVMRWMQQACSALEFAHRHSVIHRDIKPANLMLMTDDTLKVTDFGAAKILQLNTTQTAHAIGTPSYMSPEQIKGKPVDGRTDVFSLGVVLYELLTGAKPFPGESATSVIYKIVNEDPPPPRDLDSTIHPGLAAVVQRALAKSPWARFQSCREFAEALQHYQDFDEPRAARAVPVIPATPKRVPANLSNTGQNAGPLPGRTAEPMIEDTPPTRRKGGSALVALLLLAIIGAASYRVWPALQEIWGRSHPAHTEVTSADATTVDAATPAQAMPSGTVPAPIPETATRQASEQNLVQGLVKGLVKGSTQGNASANGAVATVAAPIDAPPEQSRTAGKSAALRKPGTLPSQVAAEWKDLIEAKLLAVNLQGEVQAVAVGNSVTLTGKLDTAAHNKLLAQLQFAPPGLQIIDDIEDSTEPSKQAPQGSAYSDKQ